MPDILVGSIKRAESYRHTKHALSAPHSTRHQRDLFDTHRFTAINQEFYGLVNIGV